MQFNQKLCCCHKFINWWEKILTVASVEQVKCVCVCVCLCVLQCWMRPKMNYHWLNTRGWEKKIDFPMHCDSLCNDSELVFSPHMARVHARDAAGFIAQNLRCETRVALWDTRRVLLSICFHLYRLERSTIRCTKLTHWHTSVLCLFVLKLDCGCG